MPLRTGKAPKLEPRKKSVLASPHPKPKVFHAVTVDTRMKVVSRVKSDHTERLESLANE